MKSLTPKSTALEAFLQRIPPSVQATFTSTQLDALETALEARRWSRHPVDIRFSLPLLWKRFYIVLVAGEERRGRDRRQRDRLGNPLWTWGNLLVLSIVTLFATLAFGGLLVVSQVDWQLLPDRAYPAGVPFKDTAESCELSGRLWIDGECIDYEHDPRF